MAQLIQKYLVSFSTSEARFTERGSKFLAWVTPVADEQDALTLIAARSRQYHDATHNCWAFRAGPPDEVIERSSDDGEPSGTAGKPILQRIKALALNDTLVVVTRWFGGTKLGTGGLIRAYGDCAQLALDQVDIKERIQLSTLELEIPYELIGWVINLVEGFGGVVKSGIYDAHVRLVLEIPAVNLEALRAALTEKGGGKVRIS